MAEDRNRYQMQILIVIGNGCRPNSPIAARSWLRVAPIHGIPEFGNALSALVRDGFLERKRGYQVRPSSHGYALIRELKERHRELRRRPALYDPVTQNRENDQ